MKIFYYKVLKKWGGNCYIWQDTKGQYVNYAVEKQ